jgi:hypothetical protein
MRDQFVEIANKYAPRIMFGFVRLPALPVRAQVGHDHPKTGRRNALGMAEVQPVHLRIGKQPVEEDNRAPVSYLAPDELDTVRGSPAVRGRVGHGPKVSKVALLARESAKPGLKEFRSTEIAARSRTAFINRGMSAQTLFCNLAAAGANVGFGWKADIADRERAAVAETDVERPRPS